MKTVFQMMVALSLLTLTGCTTPEAQTVEVTRIVQQTVLVTQLVEVVVTATPVPPTPTPEATATPSFAHWNTQPAADAILAAGLEFVDPRPMTKDDYGFAPMNAQEAVRFLIPSICSDCGGRLYSFSSQADLDLMKSYYDELGKQSAIMFSWLFVKDNLLIQINGDLPEDQALKYQAALDNLQ